LNVTMSPAFLDARTLVVTHMVRVIEDRERLAPGNSAIGSLDREEEKRAIAEIW
jgi:hypothetical protein